VGGQYNTVLFQRLNALKAKMTTLGIQYQPIIWYSQGINDNIAATPGATWQSRTTQHFTALREVFPTAHILMGLLTPSNAGYDVNLKAVATAGTNIQTVSALSAPTQDGNHWNTAGYRMIGGRFMDATLAILNPATTTLGNIPDLFYFGL
jgi:lysophospholipase L1-like esterase